MVSKDKIEKYKNELLDLFNLNDFPDNNRSNIERISDKKIILYGAGQGMETFQNFVLLRYGLKAHSVIDRKFKKRAYYKGIRAFPASEFKVRERERENSVVVVTVTRPEFESEILEYIKNLGFKDEQIAFAKDFYEFNLPYIPEELKEKGFRFYLENKEKIVSCLELFEDELSLSVYLNFIKTHMLKKVFPIPCFPSYEQYFPKDLKLNKGYDVMIHCGAFTGDTIRDMRKNSYKIKKLICFEPDLDNFSKLLAYLEAEKENIAEEIIILPCALYSNEKRTAFRSAGVDSSLLEKGEDIVQCVALDHVLLKFEPTYITMDIEGAELEALKGSERIIKTYKPDLAICVYHLPNHVWEIPLYLNSLNLGYKFFLRNYRGFTIETILYATA